MRKKNTGNIYGKRALSFIALILSALLFIYGCDTKPGDNVTTSAPAKTAPGNESAVTEEPPAEPVKIQDGELYKYADLVISKVYGNGRNKTAACKNSFIELKNTGDLPLCLFGLSLYYGTKDSDYISFALPDVTLGAGECFLVKGASAPGYDDASEIIKITQYDAEWSVSLDNKSVKLILGPYGAEYGKNALPENIENKISYFAADDAYHFDTGYVSGYSKNKIAIRTADRQDSGYHTVNLTKATTEKLSQIVPVSKNGTAGSVVRSQLFEVKFSEPAGFYPAPIELKLTAPEGYSRILYTTDGSDPTVSNTRRRYSGPIKLEDTSLTPFGKIYDIGQNYAPIGSAADKMLGAHVIKACAYDGEKYTGVYTNSYFINAKMASFGVSVMSVSLEVDQMFGDPGFYHNFNAVTNDPNTRGAAFMEVFDKNGVRRGYSNVELSISGHGSSGTGMRSMKVFFKGSQNGTDGTESKLNFDLFEGYSTNSKGQSITDFSRLLLRNSGNDCGVSYIRDSYMQRVSRTLNVDTMAYAPVLVFINGDFWGVYNARERYSGDYVESHYGIDKDNVALIESDYSQVHTNQNAPFIVTSGLENDADDFNELVGFIKSHGMENEEDYEYVKSRLDIDSFIDMYVSRTYFSALDWPGNNIKVWRNRASDDPSGFDNKWHFTMLDMDMGISFYTDANNTTENSNHFGWIDATGCVVGSIMHALRKNESFKNRFLSRFYQVMNEVYVPAALEAELDNIVDQRRQVTPLQSQRWGASIGRYSNAVSLMRSFVRNRYDYALRYLCSYFKVSENYLIAISGNYLSVDFPETRLNVSVDGKPVVSGTTLKFDETVTVEVKAEAKENFELIAVVFTDNDGNKKRFEGGQAKITTDRPGVIGFETKKKAVTADLRIRSGIVAGGVQMFYLSEDGKLYAWGNNNNGVLGADPGKPVVLKPELVYENVSQIEICHGNDMENNNNNVMAAILTLSGEIYVSGAPTVPGINIGPDRWSLVEYDGIPVSVSVGYDHLLVLDKDGSVWGIGNNSYGQLGAADEGGTVTEFRKIADNAVMISAGRRNTAFIDNNGDCYVLGDARWNKFSGSTENITEPYKLLSGVSFIASGEHEMLLVTEGGELYYAGWRSPDGFSQGTGSHGAAKLPIGGVSKAVMHFCDIAIMTESGDLYGYGLNNGGCIDGAVVGAPTMLVKSGVKDAAAGFAFIAYLDRDGNIVINGSNSDGQSGAGQISDQVSWSKIKID
ncbi:MAG: CotH kinase family protein [Clostridia bacterium]|nr:CotH kinase family protein [Clostridia bacterium]